MATALGTKVHGPKEGNSNATKKAALSRPPWASWHGSRAGRAIQWIETYCRIPSGEGYGQPLLLHPYQKHIVETLVTDDVRVGGLQICRGNAKSTLVAALGLWAISDGDDAPQVPLVAHDARHAKRTLFSPMRRMIHHSPELADRLLTYTASGDERIMSSWNQGELWPLPAESDRLQGLNPSIAIIDEAQTVPDAILWALRQGAGKRTHSLVLAIGTPGPDQDCALFRLRQLAAASGREAWLEYSAPEDCDPLDRAVWPLANPALETGILRYDVLEDEAEAVRLEHPGARALFRLYRLGHWVEGATGWLPPGTWEDCPHQDAPPKGTDIVVALEGTYRRSMALVGCTLDGAVFLCWAAEQASDEDVTEALAMVLDHYNVIEVAHFSRIRPDLIKQVTDELRIATYAWHGRVADEVLSTNEMFRAVLEQRIAHDHHPLIAEHMANVEVRYVPDGIRLARPINEGQWIDAAMAARMAWWRATQVETSGPLLMRLGD